MVYAVKPEPSLTVGLMPRSTLSKNFRDGTLVKSYWILVRESNRIGLRIALARLNDSWR
jgi:hypothetical protein